MDRWISAAPRLVSPAFAQGSGARGAGTGSALKKRVPWLFLLICLFATSGCGGTIAGPTAPLDEPFILTLGEAVNVSAAGLVLKFTGVTGDSRCPADAICIQGGDAIVNVQVSSGGTAAYELHTGDATRASVTHRGYLITLVQLFPYPFSSRTIPQNEYRATFTVSRI